MRQVRGGPGEGGGGGGDVASQALSEHSPTRHTCTHMYTHTTSLFGSCMWAVR